jgi:hypothetical protein
MNLTDLSHVLHERSGETAGHVMHDTRLRGVRAKVVARRRRRIATWTTCAVAALGGVAAATVAPGSDGYVTSGSPSPVRTIDGFPEYAEGARLVAVKSAALPERRVELTIVLTTLDLTVSTRCDDVGDNAVLQEKLTLNGHDLGQGDCGGVRRGSSWPRYDVAVGRSATFVLTITGTRRLDQAGKIEAQVPERGTFGLAIGEHQG